MKLNDYGALHPTGMTPSGAVEQHCSCSSVM